MRSSYLRGIVAAAATILVHEFTVAAEPQGAPIPPTPPFASPDIKPTFADWLTARPVALAKKVALTDPLQKPPFAGQPPDSLKGMAAGIRAVQLDAPNRAKAAAYLGTVDCVTYPQAQAMLIATAEEDPSEDVRYEAVMALRMMMTRGCCNMDTVCQCPSCNSRKSAAAETEQHAKRAQQALVHEAKGPAKRVARKANKTTQETRYDCCRGCCNEKVLNALASIAYGKDDQCCYLEPSERVRQAAADGLSLCAVSAAPLSTVPPVPPTVDPVIPQEVKPLEEKEVNPTAPSPELKSTLVPPAPLSALDGTKAYPAIPALGGYCIVGLKDRQFVKANAQFSSVYEEHTYYFASAAAKKAFDADPAKFAIVYGGVDPVVWLERHEIVQGQYLREFSGRFYLFSEKEMWQKFKSTPERFVLGGTDSSRQIVGR